MKVGDLVRRTMFDFYGRVNVVIGLEEALDANGPVTIATIHDGRAIYKISARMLRKVA